jgi:hypothetical protein
MKKNIILWVGTLIITFLAGYLHNAAGPYYPVSGTIGVEGKMITFKFDKIYSGNDTYNVLIRSDVKDINAFTLWRDVSVIRSSGLNAGDKKLSGWQKEIMTDSGSLLISKIPKHKPLEKIEYRVELNYKGKQYFLPEDKSVGLMFLGHVNPGIMQIFYFVLFGGLVFAVRTGLEIFNDNPRLGLYSIFTLIFFFLYAICIVPLKRTYELNALNHFVPPINSIITYQSVFLFILWIIGLILIFNFKRNKIIPIIISLLTIIIYIFVTN